MLGQAALGNVTELFKHCSCLGEKQKTKDRCRHYSMAITAQQEQRFMSPCHAMQCHDNSFAEPVFIPLALDIWPLVSLLLRASVQLLMSTHIHLVAGIMYMDSNRKHVKKSFFE